MLKDFQEKLRNLPLSLSHLVSLVSILLVLFLLFFQGNAPAMSEEKDQDEDILLEISKDFEEETSEKEIQEGSLEGVETGHPSAPELIFIDIKGAVKYPNIYEMTSGQRLYDVVEKAGGFDEHADQNQVNLAQMLHDEMVIYIPMKGEDVPEHLALSPINPPAESEGSTGQQNQKININTADANGLTALNGIGEKKAQMIVDYREEQGPFLTIEDIKNVSGIGEKSYENLKDAISVD